MKQKQLKYLLLLYLFGYNVRYINAQVLVTETFNYTSGVALHGLNGGTGWGAGWSTQNNNTTIPGYQTLNTALAYPSFTFTGSGGSGGQSYQSTGRNLDNSASGNFSAYLKNTDGNTVDGNEIGQGNLWLAFFLVKQKNDNDQVRIVLSDDDAAAWNLDAKAKISIGYFGATRFWGLGTTSNGSPTASNAGLNITLSTIPVVVGASTFMVLNILYDTPSVGTTTLRYYINPPVDITEPATPTITTTTTQNLGFKGFSNILGNDANSGLIDEIRFGQTFCNVVNHQPSCLVILPIELLYFKSEICNNDVCFDWATATELNNDYFTIEYSTDAINFLPLKKVKGAGDSQTKILYNEKISLEQIHSSSAILYFRLKQTDYNGKENYSKTNVLNNTQLNKIIIYPNPNNGRFIIQGAELNTHITIFNSIGEKITNQKIGSEKTEINLSDFSNGIYFIQLSSYNESVSQKFIINK